MNNQVLNQYKIEFSSRKFGNRIVIQVTSELCPQIGLFIYGLPITDSLDLALTALNNALANLPFESEWDSPTEYHLLINDAATSTILSYGGLPDYSLPTYDLKEIISSYIEWAETNDFKKFID